MPTRRVDHLAEEPLWQQLYEILRDQIVSGAIPVGTILNERPISLEHGVARETVRRALQALDRDGLCRALRSRGWGVLGPPP